MAKSSGSDRIKRKDGNSKKFYDNARQYGFRDPELRSATAKELERLKIKDPIYFVYDKNMLEGGKVTSDRLNRVTLGLAGLNMETIAHELKHLQQLRSGKLRINQDGDTVWKGKVYISKADRIKIETGSGKKYAAQYQNFPWEKEARASGIRAAKRYNTTADQKRKEIAEGFKKHQRNLKRLIRKEFIEENRRKFRKYGEK